MNLSPPTQITRVRSLFSAAEQNPELKEALGAAPNVPQLSAQIQTLISDVSALAPALTAEEVTAAVAASLADGSGLPDDTLTRYAEAHTAETAHNRAEVALSVLLSDLAGQRDQALTDGLDAMLAVLHRRLSRVLGDLASQLRSTKGAKSAEDAIRLGVVDEWRQASALRRQHRLLRDAQHHLTRTCADDQLWAGLQKAWPVVGYAEGLPEIWPDLPEWHRYGFTFDHRGNRQLATPPWPDPKSEQFADWLALNPEARPWVPTPQDAWKLLDRIEANTNSPARPGGRRPADFFGDQRRGERSHASSLALATHDAT